MSTPEDLDALAATLLARGVTLAQLAQITKYRHGTLYERAVRAGLSPEQLAAIKGAAEK